MLNIPFAPWPSYTEDEVQAVVRVLHSNQVNYWTGNECLEFEREFARWVGCEYAVALANGTLALDVALRAAGVGPGDEVVVTPRTFIAPVSSVVNAGARPVFADVDADSGVVTAETILPVLTPRTRAIICVHLGGWPCDMGPVMAVAESSCIKVIEDCAQAHGARCDGRKIGSIGHIGAWSFCQDKIITTGGEGGMVTTSDRALWAMMWSYKDHGKSWEAVYERQHPVGHRWLCESFGSNFRMLEVQAAIGRLQLPRLAEWARQRESNARRIAETCLRYPAVRVPTPRPGLVHAHYRLYAYVQPSRLREGWSRDRILNEVMAAGVPILAGSCPEVYLEKAFDGTDLRPLERLKHARMLGETSLAFLVHPTLTDGDIAVTCRTIENVLSRASA